MRACTGVFASAAAAWRRSVEGADPSHQEVFQLAQEWRVTMWDEAKEAEAAIEVFAPAAADVVAEARGGALRRGRALGAGGAALRGAHGRVGAFWDVLESLESWRVLVTS